MKFFNTERKYYLFSILIKRYALPVMALLMLRNGLTPSQIGLIAAIATATNFILEVPSGALSDTIGHRRTLMYSMVGQALSQALYLGGSFWFFLAGAVLYYASGSLMSGTESALFFEQLKEEGREDEYKKHSSRALSYASGVGIIAMLTSSLAFVYAWWLPFVIGVMQFILALAIVSSMKSPQENVSVKEQEGFSTMVHHFKVAYKTIQNSGPIYWLVLLNAVVFGVTLVEVQYHQVILENVGLAVALFGAFYGFKRFLTMIFSHSAHWIGERVSLTQLYVISVIGAAATLIAMRWITSPWAVFVILPISSILYPLLHINRSDYIQNRIPTGSRATLLSMDWQMMNVVEVAGGLLMSFLLLSMKVQEAYMYLGVILLVFGFYFTWRFSQADRMNS